MPDFPRLKTEIVTLHAVDYGDLEQIVHEVYADRLRYEDRSYGRYLVNEFSFVAEVECGNDTDHEVTAQHPDDLYDYEREELEAFRKGEATDYMGRPKTWPSLSVLLADLVEKGVMDAGKYLIRVSW